MAKFVAFLRAINVGGTSILPMKDLARLCMDLGLEDVRTYIQSGNVVFTSSLSERTLQSKLEKALADHMGRTVAVMLRTGSELQAILEANPFPERNPSKVAVMFLSDPAPEDLADGLIVSGPEEIRVAGRDIYVHYPDGMGRSKLKFPASLTGTVRNLNTIAKLAAMALA